jgi:hypothetical protein
MTDEQRILVLEATVASLNARLAKLEDPTSRATDAITIQTIFDRLENVEAVQKGRKPCPDEATEEPDEFYQQLDALDAAKEVFDYAVGHRVRVSLGDWQNEDNWVGGLVTGATETHWKVKLDDRNGKTGLIAHIPKTYEGGRRISYEGRKS